MTKSPWKPLPAGVIVIVCIGPTTLGLLIVAALYHAILPGVLSAAFGFWCIVKTGNAAYHAGLRAEAYSQELRKNSNNVEEVSNDLPATDSTGNSSTA